MKTDPDCIFCKIIAGAIPCHRIYEDDKVIAFLDIGPVSRGHALVVPKEHAVTLDELSKEAAAATGAVLGKVGAAVIAAIGTSGGTSGGWNVLQNNGKEAGQLVPHVHFHIIPRFADEGFSYRWQAGELSSDDAATLKEKIAQMLA